MIDYSKEPEGDSPETIDCLKCGKKTVRLKRKFYRKLSYCYYCDDCQRIYTKNPARMECKTCGENDDDWYNIYAVVIGESDEHDRIKDRVFYSRFHNE